eukprot:2710763-Karenia_brevis.AAC.1
MAELKLTTSGKGSRYCIPWNNGAGRCPSLFISQAEMTASTLIVQREAPTVASHRTMAQCAATVHPSPGLRWLR